MTRERHGRIRLPLGSTVWINYGAAPAYRAAQPFHAPATEFHARNPLQQKESRGVGTRRLPYVGDRVGGLGVRPPALGSVIW
jgi:hypothetical protein